MWSRLFGTKSSAPDTVSQDATRTARGTLDSTPSCSSAHLNLGARADPNQTEVRATSEHSASSTSTAVVPRNSSADRDATQSMTPVAAAAVASGERWGYTSTEGLRHDFDPAFEEMMSFYAFSHKIDHEYVGAISFRISYPDGGIAMRTVQVLPPEKGQQMITHTQPEPVVLQNQAVVPSRHPARVRFYPRLAGSSDSLVPFSYQLTAADSTALLPFSGRSAWLPVPCVRLTLASNAAASQTSQAVVPASAALSAALAELGPAPRIPASPRIRIFNGPAPADVKVNTTLSCPRDVFFDVYMGRLDPIKSVLSGQAHCEGYRYYQLYYFGQCFDLRSDKWREFYRVSEEIAAETKRREAILAEAIQTTSTPPFRLTSGSGGSSDSNSSSSRIVQHSSQRQIHRMSGNSANVPFSSSLGCVAVSPMDASSWLLPIVRGVAAAADATSRWVHALAPNKERASLTSAAVAGWTSPRPALPSMTHVNKRVTMPAPAPAAASLSASLQSLLQLAAQVHADIQITFACDEYA
jgi:hypothetical protein